jgi:hypothetical protein
VVTVVVAVVTGDAQLTGFGTSLTWGLAVPLTTSDNLFSNTSPDEELFCKAIRAEDYKTEIGNQSQISSIWLAEMATGRHFSQSDVHSQTCLWARDVSEQSVYSPQRFETGFHAQFYNLGPRAIGNLFCSVWLQSKQFEAQPSKAHLVF